MSFKKIAGWAHLWLGMISGIIVFIISITGAIYVFIDEIESFLEPERKVELQNAMIISPLATGKIATQIYPEKQIGGITYKAGEAINVHFWGKQYNIKLLLNPYDGQVISKTEYKTGEIDFFRFILNGHRFLWLPWKIGRPIVNYATLIFIVILITGLILWWPKNKSAAKQRWWFRWKSTTQWKRKNYDIHNVLGFYAIFFLLCIALTGMVWGIEWYSKGLYKITSGGKTLQEWEENFSDTLKIKSGHNALFAVDKVWRQLNHKHPKAHGMYISVPENKAQTIYTSVYTSSNQFYKNNSYEFDQYTLKEIIKNDPYSIKYEEASFADKLRKMNYDIHVGSILGLPGKFLAFFAALICASLPITGFYIWWGRRKKTKKNKSGSGTLSQHPDKRGTHIPQYIFNSKTVQAKSNIQ